MFWKVFGFFFEIFYDLVYLFNWCCIVRLVSHFQLENCPKLGQNQNVQNANKMLNFAFQDFCILLVLNMLIFCLSDFFSAAGGPAFVDSSYGSCCRCCPPSPSILRSREVGLPFWRRAAPNPDKEGQPRPREGTPTPSFHGVVLSSCLHLWVVLELPCFFGRERREEGCCLPFLFLLDAGVSLLPLSGGVFSRVLLSGGAAFPPKYDL